MKTLQNVNKKLKIIWIKEKVRIPRNKMCSLGSYKIYRSDMSQFVKISTRKMSKMAMGK